MIDLRALIRDAIAGGVVDPGDIAAKIEPKIPDEDLREVLTSVLRPYVRNFIHTYRMHVNQSPRDEDRAPDEQVTTGYVSRKVRGIAEHWAEFCQMPVSLSEDRSTWKALGDCTVDDLKKLVSVLRTTAKRTTEAANKYERLISYLKVSGVERVRDLPVDAADILRTK